MFYRKYRPQRFSEISKPNDTAEALMLQIKNKKTAQSYLFSGSRGTGKTTTARILAKALNCQNLDKNGDPCDVCESCIAIKNSSFMDLMEIDAASNRGIDDIRDLKDKVRLAPTLGKKKVYIIDEVHMLTTEAFNALLKTLEEPPKHAVFILCTTELHKVPDTIKSRCQVFKFRRATINQIVSRLEELCKAEGANISKDDLKKIAAASAGGFRDADTLLQQVIEGGVSVESFAGMNNKKNYADLIQDLLSGETYIAIKRVNKMYEDGADLYVWVNELLKYLRDLLFVSSGAGNDAFDVTDDLFVDMKTQAEILGVEKISRSIELFMKASNLVKSSAIPQLPVELAIVEIASMLGLSLDSLSIPPKLDLPNTTKAGLRARNQEENLKEEASGNLVNAEVLKIEISEIESKWEQILKAVVTQNSGIQALLKSSKPIKIEGGSIILEVSYSFHKERLENPKNRKLVEEVLKDIFGFEISIKCTVGSERPKKSFAKESGVLTDYNVSAPISIANPSFEGSILEVFDGGLPLAK